MRRLLGIGFWISAVLLLGVIAFGISTSGLKTDHTWLVYPSDRLLHTRPAGGVRAELRVRDLEKERPVLVVRGEGFDDDVPLRLVLSAPTRGEPAALQRAIEVGDDGRVRSEVRLPERALFNYRTVIGIQGNRVVFRASLS